MRDLPEGHTVENERYWYGLRKPVVLRTALCFP